MDTNRKLNNDLEEARNKHPAIYDEVTSTEGVRTYAAHRLRKAHLLKQLEEAYELYDCVDPSLFKEAEPAQTEYFKQKGNTSVMIALMSSVLTFGFLMFRKQNPFVYETYLNELKTFPIVFLSSYSILKWMNNNALSHYEQSIHRSNSISLATAMLHSYSTTIFNDLKYDISDLI